jgi:hypothetical protein
VETAHALAERVGLAAKARFIRASALEIPFADGSFDIVWTEHARMNIADKNRFDELVKSQLNDGFVKTSPAKAEQGAQKLRSETHLWVRRNDEVEAQRSRWTLYETIRFSFSLN